LRPDDRWILLALVRYPGADGTLVPDVRIGDWKRPWNIKPRGAAVSAVWATDEQRSGQAGTVYTAQGFEFDYAGVIIGPDFVVRDGRFVARPEFSQDPALCQRNKQDPEEAGKHIRNTYRGYC